MVALPKTADLFRRRLWHPRPFPWRRLAYMALLKKEEVEAVDEAIAKSELVLLERIHEASKQNWQAAAWILERRFPERWGRRERLNVTQTSVVAGLDENARLKLLSDPDVQEATQRIIEQIERLDRGGMD